MPEKEAGADSKEDGTDRWDLTKESEFRLVEVLFSIMSWWADLQLQIFSRSTYKLFIVMQGWGVSVHERFWGFLLPLNGEPLRLIHHLLFKRQMK